MYDPNGLVAPYTAKARLLIRISGHQGDDDLPEAIVTQFWESSRKLPLLSETVFPRSYFQETEQSYEIHMFGDSSQDVCSAVAFPRGKLVTKGPQQPS